MAWLEPIDEREVRRFTEAMRERAVDKRDDVAEQLAALAHHTREVIEPRLREVGELMRREAPVVAEAAKRQAAHMARAAKADPVPLVVGVIGLALVANLIFGRRRS